jgi:hypothetical protein
MACVPGVQNFRVSTENPSCPPAPPTGAVDKKTGLTCADGVIHRFHRPYYYSHIELARNPLRSGTCAQLGAGAPTPSRRDLTPSSDECRRRTSDWFPQSTKSQQQPEAVPVKIRVRARGGPVRRPVERGRIDRVSRALLRAGRDFSDTPQRSGVRKRRRNSS